MASKKLLLAALLVVTLILMTVDSGQAQSNRYCRPCVRKCPPPRYTREQCARIRFAGPFCSSSAECEEGLKCCSNGCVRKCVEPLMCSRC